MANIGADTVDYNEGRNAVIRTVDKRLQDFVSVKDYGAKGDGSTSDQFAIQTAVATAYVDKKKLYWPDGSYLSDSTINYLHLIPHFGEGVIVRGSNRFKPGQWEDDQTNKIYVSKSGNNLNDGLSEGNPIDTLQQAIDCITNFRPNLTGNWEILVSAGEYTRITLPARREMTNPIKITGADVGAHPSVPTTIIRSIAGATGNGIAAYENDISLTNILIVGFNQTNSSSGVSISRRQLFTNNVHFTNCYYGITAGDHSVINVKGGIFDHCGYLNGDDSKGTGHAIRTIFLTKWAVGDQQKANLTYGPIIRNCAGAARVQELCTGHFDYVTVEDCNSGLRISVNSRLNIGGSSFKRISGTAVECTEGSYGHRSAATVFGTGIDRNGRDFEVGINSSASTGAFEDINMNVARARNLISFRTGFNVPAISSTSPSNNIDQFKLAPNFFNDDASIYTPAKKVSLVIKGNTSGSNGTKTLSLMLGTTPFYCTIPQAATGSFHVEFSVQFIGPGSQIFSYIRTLAFDGTVIPNHSAQSVDMSIAQPIMLNAWVANATDNIIILSYEWFGQGL